MPHSNLDMIHRLQVALNSKGHKILVNRKQFYSEEKKMPITIYVICKSIFNTEKGRTESVELFSAPSQIQAVLFLRNLWNMVRKEPIPPTNEIKGAEKFQKKWDEFYEKYKNSELFDLSAESR